MTTAKSNKRLPWAKWTWDHWENDPALALCSMAAQGFWMRLLCIAAKEGGYLLISGKPPTDDDIAFVTRQSPENVRAWLSELERREVFSRTSRGVIYSRRMVRDEQRMKDSRDTGALGGNPKLKGSYNKPGFVYLMGVRGDGSYKIGISVNPTNRLHKVRAQYPGDNIQLLETWPVGDMGAVEARAHAMFKGKQSGEWFKLTLLDIGKLKEFFVTLKPEIESELEPEPDKEPELEEERKQEPPKPPEGAPPPPKIILRKADVEAARQTMPTHIRGRSPTADIEKALKSAARRGFPPADIIAALVAYYASPDVAKDDHRYAKGAHRIIQADRWRDFAQPTDAPLLQSVANAQDQSNPWIARPDKDGFYKFPASDDPDKPRLMMAGKVYTNAEWEEEVHSRAVLRWLSDPPGTRELRWNVERDGPAPGAEGCRIPAAIQRRHGVEPYQASEAA